MESKICMNASCRATTTHEWKKGWSLRSGGFADLCYTCGSAYEKSVFCDMFHKGESGWRECIVCGKGIHCGCVASLYMFEHLDFGGVGCLNCAKNAQLPLAKKTQGYNGFGTFTLNNVGAVHSTSTENRGFKKGVNDGKLAQLCKIAEIDGSNLLSQSQGGDIHASLRKVNGEVSPVGELGKNFLNAIQRSDGSSHFAKPGNDRPRIDVPEIHQSLVQPSLNISLGRTPNFLPPSLDTKEESKAPSSFQQGQRSRPILPKPQKAGSSSNPEANKNMVSQIRIARPPAEGRGKNQLLPRYWPRMSDQELQQICGNLNSTVVPLFEKVLSASDAGRIGRLVLPKACAEAYFPHISQSEGIPIKIQDINGKEWTFQFRFWPNNNSRMYVLEGVTPCIQSMQLHAGDTVIFSRKDPEGRLVIGFRKASSSTETEDPQPSDLPNGSRDPHTNATPERSHSTNGDIAWHMSEKNGSQLNGDSRPQTVPNSEKKKSRNIGSKSKRLLMNSEDVLELRLTWEEAQDLLRPPPSVKPTIVTIEDLEFEEYDEPPVFGKRTIFTALPSGEQQQWAQCDNCCKWRRLPVDALLPPKWTCSENTWDQSRSNCSAPDELNPKELDHLLRMSKEFKKRKIIDSHNSGENCEPSGLDALASAAVLGDSMGEQSESSVGATTKHPRHRPGCTCIVCIQPPSGKGKHKSTCICNVCMTVKRRFKTLMLRKKKRQSENEAEVSQKDHNDRDDPDNNGSSRHAALNFSENEESSPSRMNKEVPDTSTGQIDLNCDPEREDMQLEAAGEGMMSLAHTASLPLENHVKENGFTGLRHGQHSSLRPHEQTPGESERAQLDEGGTSSSAREHESKSVERSHEPNSNGHNLS